MDKFELLYRWIRLMQSGVSLEKLLLYREARRVGVYGYDPIAECMVYELKESSVQIVSLIDQKGEKVLIDYPACKPSEIKNLDLDAIIVMAVGDFQVIKKELHMYTSAPVISVVELLYEL